jgi:hypothetical protein
VEVSSQQAWHRVVKVVTRAPENSMIGYRRRYLSDRIWFGLGFIAAGLGSLGTVEGWWKAVNLAAVAVGALLAWSGARRALRRVRANDTKIGRP